MRSLDDASNEAYRDTVSRGSLFQIPCVLAQNPVRPPNFLVTLARSRLPRLIVALEA